MNTNSNNLEPEFDTRLKAHIKMQGTTTVCEGFDFDTASAYLEHTLQSTASTLYEEHLVACAACRNQVVELSRLMPAENVVAPTIAPVRTKWSEWFSGWKLGMLAGLGTATAAILLFTMVTIQRENTTQTVGLSKEVSAPASAESVANDSLTEMKETAKRDAAKGANPAPSTFVLSATPAQGAAAKSAVPVTEEAKKSIQVDGVSRDKAPQSPPAPVADTSVAVTAESKDVVIPQGQLQRSEWLQRALPTPTPHGPSANQNQMQNVQMSPGIVSAPKPMVKAAESLAKSEERQAEKVKERAKFADAEKAERDDKSDKLAAPAAAGASVGRAAKSAPLKNVAGKIFRFENNRWVDTQLTSGMPEIRLKRNSDEYKKVLKDTPELKAYFDLKMVTVVWQGKAYRVE